MNVLALCNYRNYQVDINLWYTNLFSGDPWMLSATKLYLFISHDIIIITISLSMLYSQVISIKFHCQLLHLSVASNPWYTTLEASMLTITPSMRLLCIITLHTHNTDTHQVNLSDWQDWGHQHCLHIVVVKLSSSAYPMSQR